MILVDDRAGSDQLIPRLGELAMPCRLDFGDCAFHGNGPTGDVQVGVEVKRVSDLLTSEADGRLAGHQLPGMLELYTEPWLLVVGQYGVDNRGRLVVRRGKSWRAHRVGNRDVPYGYLEAFLIEMQVIGISVKHVYDYDEAAAWLSVLYRWWDKPWHKHKAMRKTNNSGAGLLLPGLDANTEQMVRTFQTFPGLGFERALAAAGVFPSVETGVAATEQAWATVPGVGKVLSRAIKRAVKGEVG